MNVKPSESTLRSIAALKESIRQFAAEIEKLQAEGGKSLAIGNLNSKILEVRGQLRLISKRLEAENRDADRFIATPERGFGRLRMPVTRSEISNCAASLRISEN